MIEVRIGAEDFARLGNMLAAAGPKARHAQRRAINRAGDMARTQMIRALTAQTGLKRAVIVRALRVSRAVHGGALDGVGSGGLSYAIRSRGGDVSLKFFGARETRKGVSAAPFGKRRVFASTFIKGGRFPNRVALKMGGQVMARVGGARLPIQAQDSGVIIPEQMVEGATRAAFFSTVERVLPDRLAHELARILG